MTALDSRLLDVTFTDPLTRPPLGHPHARILLPAGYAGSGRTYPVLYLLHGIGDTAAAWSSNNDGQSVSLEQFTADKDVVVVMPDGGRDADAGWYSDWFNGGAQGPPKWETFHLQQLVDWVQRHFRVRTDRGGRAIAGLSMGGFGAMSYAGRHPGMFVAALSFSGAVDLDALPYLEPAGLAALNSRYGTPSSAVWGTFQDEEIRWRGHNPADLAAWNPHDRPGTMASNLEGTVLWATTGAGAPGGPAPDDADPSNLAIESAIFQMNNIYDASLTVAGVAHSYRPYAQGGHDWWHWQQDLRDAWPVIAAAFASPPPAPTRFDVRSMETNFDAWGWTFAVARATTEFLDAEGVGARGLTLSGSGRVTVTTAPVYAPGSRLRLTSSNGRVVAPALRAGSDGRARFDVVLGPSHTVQELTPAGRAAAAQPGYWETVHLDIAVARGEHADRAPDGGAGPR